MTGSFAGGLFGLALLSLIAALVCAFFLDIPDVTKQPKIVAARADCARMGAIVACGSMYRSPPPAF
jgi:hypothetical protein